jgi:hypothetical protein
MTLNLYLIVLLLALFVVRVETNGVSKGILPSAHSHRNRLNPYFDVISHAIPIYAVNIYVSEFSLDALTFALRSYEVYNSDNLSHFVLIWHDIELHGNIVDVIGKVIDRFITPRPWWLVESQPFELSSSSVGVHMLLIPTLWKNHFYSISSHLFLSESLCSQRPLSVSYHPGDTWGNRAVNVHYEWEKAQSSVFTIYVTETGQTTDNVPFVDAQSCPNLINKWECLFLPSTNCTLPSILTNCHDRHCLSRLWGNDFFTTATSNGTRITDEEHDSYVDYIRTHYPKTIHKIVSPTFLGLKSRRPLDKIDLEHTVSTMHEIRAIERILLMNGVLQRFNYFFRAKIYNRALEFRFKTSPMFKVNDRCVAAHYRQQDRTVAHVNILEWCQNCTVKVNDEIQYRQENPYCQSRDYPTWLDKGCTMPVPFGVITLSHIVNASRILHPDNRNLFIMTDDPKLLQEHIDDYNRHLSRYNHSLSYHNRIPSNHQHKRLHNIMEEKSQPPDNQINIYVLGAKLDHRKSSFQSSIDFWASIKIAKQCDGFVGHFGSAATRIIHDAICFRNGANKFMVCPKTYDLSALNL